MALLCCVSGSNFLFHLFHNHSVRSRVLLHTVPRMKTKNQLKQKHKQKQNADRCSLKNTEHGNYHTMLKGYTTTNRLDLNVIEYSISVAVGDPDWMHKSVRSHGTVAKIHGKFLASLAKILP